MPHDAEVTDARSPSLRHDAPRVFAARADRRRSPAGGFVRGRYFALVWLAVELDRVDSVPIRPATIGAELCAEESASQSEPVVRPRKNRVGAEAKTRIAAVSIDRTVDA